MAPGSSNFGQAFWFYDHICDAMFLKICYSLAPEAMLEAARNFRQTAFHRISCVETSKGLEGGGGLTSPFFPFSLYIKFWSSYFCSNMFKHIPTSKYIRVNIILHLLFVRQSCLFVCLFILFNHGVKACFQLRADFQQGREQYNEIHK